MSKNESSRVELQRDGEKTRRRFPVFVVLLIILLAGTAAVLVWLRIPKFIFDPAPTLPPQANAGESGILYETNFDDEAAGADWELFDDGFISARLEEGRLVVAVDDFRDNGGYSTLGLSFSDFVLDLEATKLGGSDDNGIFVVFAQTDTRNYNRFDISSDGFYALSEVRDGIARTVSEFRISTAINRGDAANQLRVIGIGGTYRFLVNGQTLEFCISSDAALQPLWETPLDPTSACLGGEISDRWTRTDILAGKIGLGAQGFTGFDGENDTPAQAIIGFDNVRVLTPAAAGVQ